MKLAWTFFIYILLSVTSAYAVDWSAYGLGQVAETKQDKQTIYRLLDKDGR